jgi:PAS domain-containing protein
MGIKTEAQGNSKEMVLANSGQNRNPKNFSEITKHERLKSLFSDLIDVMDIAMWELDLNYRVITSNKKAKEIYGEDIIGKFCYDVSAKRDEDLQRLPSKDGL